MQEYSIEELIYEWHIVKGQVEYREELNEEASDKIEEAKLEEDSSWADQMEAEFAAMDEPAETKKEPEPEPEPVDPLKDPENIKWMEKEMKESKLFFGDDFGEDLSLDFDPEKGK